MNELETFWNFGTSKWRFNFDFSVKFTRMPLTIFQLEASGSSILRGGEIFVGSLSFIICERPSHPSAGGLNEW